jgi:hypothetical protein
MVWRAHRDPAASLRIRLEYAWKDYVDIELRVPDIQWARAQMDFEARSISRRHPIDRGILQRVAGSSGEGGPERAAACIASASSPVNGGSVSATCHGWMLHQLGARCAAPNSASRVARGTGSGRKPRVLHMCNVANYAYANARLMRQHGVEADVVDPDFYHIMATPEWYDAIVVGDYGNEFFPD